MSQTTVGKCVCGGEAFIEWSEKPSFDPRKPNVGGKITYCAVCGRKRARFVKKDKQQQSYSFKYAPRKGYGPQQVNNIS
jgi:hypothetical protein